MIFKRLFVKKPDAAKVLYGAIVASARQPKFFAQWGVPDSVDGRFDMIVLHMFLILQRLKTDAPAMCQSLTDHFFTDMDRSLREMGVGDLSVGKKVRKMAEAYHGRLNAYATGVEQGEPVLIEALQRNVYGGEQNARAKDLARWVGAAQSGLAGQSTADILATKVIFE
jgi:cytochrome b pre-mRNA-processing protein 3